MQNLIKGQKKQFKDKKVKIERERERERDRQTDIQKRKGVIQIHRDMVKRGNVLKL